jgi:hypothetical protein
MKPKTEDKRPLLVKLKARGYDVHLRHELFYGKLEDGTPLPWTKYEMQSKYGIWYPPDRTVATVRSEGGAEATAIARVSPKDHFCRKRGREIAIGRALKQLGTSFKRLGIRP